MDFGIYIVGTVASGGLLAPASLAIGTTLLGGEAAYRAISGETITGEVLSTEQRLWAGAEAVTTLASGGIGTYMKGANLTERTVSQGLLNADKAARYGANAYDVAQFGHDFNEDPKMALTNLATSQLVGRTIGHLGNKYKAFRASKTGNVDIRSGEATSFKTNLKDRVRTAWTDIKTKTGDVKVQVGEGFDNFKNRVSNMKNRAMASGAEKVSEKLENLNAELGVRRKNFQRNLAAMQGQRELEFQLSGETPGIGVTANYSERLENLTKKIQQFSVEHRQKIQNFEGRGGGYRDSKVEFDDISDSKIRTPERIISERTKGLDLEPHPTTQKQLSPKKMKELKQKITNRTITREEYEQYNWNKRFSKRRRDGVDLFWFDKRKRLMNGEAGSREWTSLQRQDIVDGKKPTYNGKTVQGHHTYSASQYPHLANRPEIIFPATFNEHFYGWHGGNWKTSLPGERINIVEDF